MGCSPSKPATLEPGRGVLVDGDAVSLLARVRAHAQAGVSRAVLEPGPASLADEAWTVSYRELCQQAESLSLCIASLLVEEQVRHVVYLVSPGVGYVVVQLAVWGCGGVCVPLSTHSAPSELERLLTSSDCALAIADGLFEAKLRPPAEKLGRRFASLAVGCGPEAASRFVLSTCPGADGLAAGIPRPDVEEGSPAMILYTAGATGSPRGVVHTHRSLTAQVELTAKAWRWSRDDHSLLVLPLHHIYGVQASLNTALWSGAAVELARFNPARCVQRLASGHITCFHAVPTMYAQLLQQLESMDARGRAEFRKGASCLRYMASGMVALPASTARAWAEASGHVLLEQYGTTETGVALSNRVGGARYPGCVGFPLPQLDVRSDDDRVLLVRGRPLFHEYYGEDKATREAFTKDGWFYTGDVVAKGGTEAELQDLLGSAEAHAAAAAAARVHPPEPRSRPKSDELTGIYTLKGNSSWDTVQCGGHRISVQEVECVLMEHQAIKECAVVGKPDELWGERVTAVCKLHAGGRLGLEELRSWATTRLATYKLPSGLVVVDELPRNRAGKLEKGILLSRLRETQPSSPARGAEGVAEAEDRGRAHAGTLLSPRVHPGPAAAPAGKANPSAPAPGGGARGPAPPGASPVGLPRSVAGCCEVGPRPVAAEHC